MRAIVIPILLFTALHGGWQRDTLLYRAQQAIGHQQWAEALNAYAQIHDTDDTLRFNIATLHYRLGHYRRAFALYARIRDPRLEYKRLHNLGNCALHLQEPARAAALYRAAQRLHPAEATRHNLALATRLLTRQKQKIGAACTTDILPRRRSRKEGLADFDDTTTSDEGTWSETNRTIIRADNVARPHTAAGADTAHTIAFDNTPAVIKPTPPAELSHREEAKWDRTLRNRPLKTLLIPLDYTRGDTHETRR